MSRKITPSSATVALVQMACSEHPEENLKRAASEIEKAHRSGAQIVCLSELFRTQYFPQKEDFGRFTLAEAIPGPTTEILTQLARSRKLVLIASLFEKRAQGIYYNTAVVIDADGAMVGKYRKMHIPDDPGFYEKFYFTPGDLGFKAFSTRYARVGVLVCWDQWFPEAARLTALEGAQILFYPTAIGWNVKETEADAARSQHDSWETVQRSHAIANGVYVAAANRVGLEENLQFWGSSFVADPFGAIIGKANDRREEILLAECHFAKIDEIRLQWPFLRDRRIDAYGALIQRKKKIREKVNP